MARGGLIHFLWDLRNRANALPPIRSELLIEFWTPRRVMLDEVLRLQKKYTHHRQH